MAKIYTLKPGEKSKKSKISPIFKWKELLLLSCFLNCLQIVAYILKH